MSSPTLQQTTTDDDILTGSDLKASKLSQEEIKSAFAFLDVEKSGQVSLANLKKRLGVFFPDMTPKEYKFLMNNRKELTIEDLNELLVENEISDAEFDPILEAFKVRTCWYSWIWHIVMFLDQHKYVNYS
jgi:Ca2+-binding EF-hand superfamily protein